MESDMYPCTAHIRLHIYAHTSCFIGTLGSPETSFNLELHHLWPLKLTLTLSLVLGQQKDIKLKPTGVRGRAVGGCVGGGSHVEGAIRATEFFGRMARSEEGGKKGSVCRWNIHSGGQLGRPAPVLSDLSLHSLRQARSMYNACYSYHVSLFRLHIHPRKD